VSTAVAMPGSAAPLTIGLFSGSLLFVIATALLAWRENSRRRDRLTINGAGLYI
jgi:hypothetical protein